MNIKPPEGYRLMLADEKPIRKIDDLQYTKDYGWNLTCQVGQYTVEESIQGLVLAYARKIV